MADFKTVRVIAASAANPQQHETVNIATTKRANNPQFLQITAAQALANPNRFETVKDSAGTITGLRTICITGYSAPN